MVDYNELRKKFPTKDPLKRKRAAAIKAIAREYERKRAELGGLRAPVMKKGIVFYVVVVIGLLMLGALVLSATGHGGRARIDRALLDSHKSVDALAIALGRYRYHVGEYPSTEEGLDALASTTVRHKGWNGPYIRQVVKDPWGRDYVYVCNGAAENPTLYSKGPDGLAGTTDDILPDQKLFDAPFRDTSWTQGWMPYQLRGYVLASDDDAKKAIEKQVQEYLHPVLPREGETDLLAGWSASAGGSFARTFAVPVAATNAFVALRIDGAMTELAFTLNGRPLAPVKGAAFEIDLTGLAECGKPNRLEVRPGPYFREAKLVVEDAEDRLIYDSLAITVGSLDEETAKIHVAFDTPAGAGVNDLEITAPIAWCPERPFLYRYVACGRSYPYAVRRLAADASGALTLNGAPFALKGVNIDALLGPEGPAPDRDGVRRLLLTLKDLGANAIAKTALADGPLLRGICDETGFLIVTGDFVSVTTLCDRWGLPLDSAAFVRAKWNGRDATVSFADGWREPSDPSGTVKVSVATSGDEAELFVNNDSRGRVKVADARAEWTVGYEPGEIKVIAFANGTFLGEDTRRTVYKPVAVSLEPEKDSLADGEIAFVRTDLVDEYETVSAADAEIRYALEGPGEIVRSDARGALVRRTGGSGLPLKLTATASGLRSAAVTLPLR